MPGYFGTNVQRQLQAQAEASAELIRTTPGMCQNGRMMGCDDPDLLGWDRIADIIQRDRVIGFRLISASAANKVAARVAELGCRLDTWDVFVAERDDALAASRKIVSCGLLEGLRDLPVPTNAEGDYTARIQALMGEAGIVPFSGSLLVGDSGPATTAAVGHTQDAIAAVAHGYLPHNSHSPYTHYAWGGLVAVAEPQRGKGLGNYINAKIIVDTFDRLGATHVYELVSASNLPSRRMVEACGLRHEPSLVCGAATPAESGRYTR